MLHRSPLFGRRIHIAGSAAQDPAVASTSDVDQARELVATLVPLLIERGATFVLPVDAEPVREGDQRPVCFDWLVWATLQKHLHRRPDGAVNPLVIAVQHHKTEQQIPTQYHTLWDGLRGTDLVQIENVSHWDMNSKRMEAQARFGDILIAIGGSDGVQFLANLYHEAGKPVIPLNCPVTEPDRGALRLFTRGLSSAEAARLFKVSGTPSAHGWVNRINFSARTSVAERAERILALLEALEPPPAFVIRLLDPKNPDYEDVQEFFDVVVQPIVEDELGYRMIVVDGHQPYEHARIDQDVFVKLHHSRVVVADITGSRPNCFLELGYALGRGLPVMLSLRDGEPRPFDLTTFAALHWQARGDVEERRHGFRKHWGAIESRPPLVPPEPLIP